MEFTEKPSSYALSVSASVYGALISAFALSLVLKNLLFVTLPAFDCG